MSETMAESERDHQCIDLCINRLLFFQGDLQMTPGKDERMTAESIIEEIKQYFDTYRLSKAEQDSHKLSAQKCIEHHLKQAREEGFAEGIEKAAKVCEEEKLIHGQTKVVFDSDCLAETKEQPEVALRKMHNAAVDNCIDGIKALRPGGK